MIVGTFIGNCFGTRIFYSGVEVGSGVGMTGGARGIVHHRRSVMYSTALVVVSP